MSTTSPPVALAIEPDVTRLHAVRLEAVVALYAAGTQEERDALFEQAALLSTALGLPVPVLPPDKTGMASATVAAFWIVVGEAVATGMLHDHSHTADRLAVSLPEVRDVAEKMGRPLPPGASLTRALARCPRLIAPNYTVNSRIREKGGKGIAVRCWVFKK
ncbi:hypothetical protein [Stenotrophomonas maltophilia]|uniref:hypothetical protein n=1 Tax=Stenotrophomonas maltophilia TaxID=40324 RepID=UPI0013DA9F69|nr:hypothetical protein [Stenotrophomonas maltophilia]